MLECRSCMVRCMRAIAADAIPTAQPLRHGLLLTPQLSNRPSRRAASTATAQRFESNDAPDDATATVTAPADGPKDWAKPAKPGAIVVQNQKALEMELRYLKDPLKLVEHVRYTLRDSKPDKALDLCRLASKTMSCVVSWNAVLDWYLRKLKVNKAVEVYNEMKKRAQFPDSFTYMLLLRGLGLRSHVQQPVRQENVTKAVSIYNSMFAPTSRIKPSIMHTNAALNVCSQALDIDALWAIAEKIPERGIGAANNITYTIILNAIRFNAYGDNPEGVSLDQIAARRQKAVNEGRRVWLDVIRKWRSGSLEIDEDLVGAMGRLLLTSKSIQDWDNVLDLVQQTMNIERQVPSVRDSTRNTQHVPQLRDALDEAESPAENDVDDKNPQPEDQVDEGFTDSPAATAFKKVTALPPEKPRSKQSPSLAWVTPGSQTLSLLIDACQQMRTPKTATAYWDLFTSPPYSLQPDLRNFDAQLRLLALNRASAKVAHLLTHDLPQAGIEPKNSTFRVAMHACQRDVKNPRVLEHATTVIDVMEKVSEDPDHQTLIEYLSLALTANNGKDIVAAINRLDPIVHNMRSLLNIGSQTGPRSPEARGRDNKGIINFLSALTGAMNTVLNRGLVPEADIKFWGRRRSDLNHYVSLQREKHKGQMRQLDEKRDADGERRYARRGEDRQQKLSMSRAQWALRTARGKSTGQRVGREEGRERRFNPPREDGGKRVGYGMDG